MSGGHRSLSPGGARCLLPQECGPFVSFPCWSLSDVGPQEDMELMGHQRSPPGPQAHLGHCAVCSWRSSGLFLLSLHQFVRLPTSDGVPKPLFKKIRSRANKCHPGCWASWCLLLSVHHELAWDRGTGGVLVGPCEHLLGTLIPWWFSLALCPGGHPLLFFGLVSLSSVSQHQGLLV